MKTDYPVGAIWLLVVSSSIPAVPGCLGGDDYDAAKDEACYQEYTDKFSKLAMDKYDCFAESENQSEEQECLDAYKEAYEETEEEYKTCYPEGGCIDKTTKCRSKCETGDDDCIDDCRKELGKCADWYDADCIINCTIEFNSCIGKHVDESDPDWSAATYCRSEYDLCCDDCFD